MKRFLTLLACVISAISLLAQGWTADELGAASVGSNKLMTEQENEALLYLNLVRLYPQKFCQLEVIDYYGSDDAGHPSMLSDNRTTLIAELMQMKPVGALVFSEQKYYEAECLAKKQSKDGKTGHDRKGCKSTEGAENCSYGSPSGKEMLLMLLLDEGVERYGHRENCLNAGLGSVGIKIMTHPVFRYCLVMDFGWGNYELNSQLAYHSPKDLSKQQSGEYYALMTRNVDPALANSAAAHHRTLAGSTQKETTKYPNGTVSVKTVETKPLDNGRKLIITTITESGGPSPAAPKVTYEVKK